MDAFERFSAGTLNHILYYLQPIKLTKGNVLYKEGDVADSLYVITNKEGSVVLSR